MATSTPQDSLPNGIISWFTQNPVAANLLMLIIIFGGVSSAFTIKKEFFPDTSLDSLTIRVPYLGAAPEEVEEGVILKIEEAIQDVNGIREILSTASEGVGIVRVEVDEGYDVKNVLDEVKVRVDAIQTFPGETEKPIIFENVMQRQVMWVMIYGDAPERQLKEYAKQVRDEMLDLPEITRAEVQGARAYEISIEVSENDLRSYGLTFEDVVQAVRRSSLDLPAGSIKTVGGEILLRSKGQAYTGEQFASIILLRQPDGTELTLGDIARIVDGFEDTNYQVRFDGFPSVGVEVFRVGDQSTLEVSRQVRQYVEEKQDSLPHGIQLTYWADGSELLRGRLNLMLKNAGFGGALVLLTLALFLRLKVALWVAVGIPVAFLGTVFLMPMTDTSINMLTLFGFILVLGIVVDDAIVIGENIYTTTRRDGHSMANVIKGANEVAMPATFGVLTTVVAFMPMLMIPGVQGKIWSGIAVVIILCLLLSLVESKFILPAHLAETDLSLDENAKRGPLSRFQRFFADGLHGFVKNRYEPVLRLAVKRRGTTLAIFIGLFFITISLISNGIVRFVFFPNIPTDYPTARLQMVEGTPASVTHAAAARMETALLELVREIEEESGENVLDHYLILSTRENAANFSLQMSPAETRKTGTLQFINRWREKVGPIAGSEELTFRATLGPGSRSAAINIQLEGTDYAMLDAASDALKEHLASYAQTFDITDSFSAGKQEILLDLQPGAEVLGVSRRDLAQQVRYGFYGAEAQRIQRGQDEVKVMIRYPENERRSLGDLENMRIRTATGAAIPFGEVATADLGRGYASIQRVDRRRAITVSADLDKDKAEPGAIIEAAQKDFLANLSSRFPGVTYQLAGQSEQQAETMASLRQNGILALFLIYALMAIPLKSYWKPLIIMSVIPFGFIGAVVGHLVLNLPISILSMTGILALAGVVVNDSLVMVDFINKRLEEGMTRFEAIMESGPRRFRAILLTSLTTFLGLFPMLLERSLQAQFLIPMAASLAFGIVFATIITLLLVPALYLLIDDFKRLFTKPDPDSQLSESQHLSSLKEI